MDDFVSVRSSNPKQSQFDIGNWVVCLTEHHILKSMGEERQEFEKHLSLPSLPEMIFDKNCLRISCKDPDGPAIYFRALDALALVNATEIPLELPVAKDWREARLDQKETLDKPKPFDWTYTTPYNGSLVGKWSVMAETDGLDMALLQRRDPILFYADTTLYEDELGDNGVAMLNVKFRAMASGFFLLQRFFLRVDRGLVRCYDTRVQWRQGDSYLIRDINRSESSTWRPEMVGITLMEADRVCDRLLEHRSEKLIPLAN